nr:unnamed protein product [Digitaria exilis]
MDIINGAVLPRYAGPAAATRTSDGDGAAAANFDASGEKFVDSSIIEAVELRTVSDGFVIKMRDGKDLRMRCVQNNPRVLRLRDSAPHHAIVLKMEATFCSRLLSGLETPSIMLLAALRNIRITSLTFFFLPRPTIYNVSIEMTKKDGNENGNEEDTISFNLKPSNAINIAFRCNVCISVFASFAIMHST